MTPEHKAALARGRAEARAVRNYLEAWEENRPRRGRRRTPESIQKRLDRIDEELVPGSPLKRLQLIQERLDLKEELVRLENPVDMSGLEDAFVEAAKGYGERKGISYEAWRELGVPAALLKRAGITRGS